VFSSEQRRLRPALGGIVKPLARVLCSFSSGRFPKFLSSALALAAVSAGGCGGSGGGMASPVGPTPVNASVVLLASSTANDQLSQFNITFNSLTLTSQSGKTVTVFSSPQQAEFIHLNGTAEPLFTASIPADTYVSASAVIPPPQVTCVTLQSGNSILTDEFQSGTQPTVTLNFPSPIQITGATMGLLLNLQVSASVTPSGCPLTPNNPTINAGFNVTPVTLAATPTNIQNGLLSSLQGLISAVNSSNNTFTVTASDGPVWSVRSGNNTNFQGVAAFSTLAVGMAVDFDVAIQSDGSLLATRVEVPDPNPSNLTLVGGPLLYVISSNPVLLSDDWEQQGLLFPGKTFGAFYVSFPNATFQTTGRFANLQSLPFAPNFTASSMFAGQNIILTSHATTVEPEPTYAPASTITLMPQTLDGVVTATGTEGSFTTYTISLASYDLIPDLAVQGGQTTILTDPSTVIVYVDSSTQTLSTTPLAVGATFRFNGLLFNDNGTLRMDAAQINDGVPQ
jgi:hypothetical protein